MRSNSTSIFLILILATTVSAQSGLESRVDAVVQEQMTDQKVPGLSVAVVKDGKPLLIKGYGLANVEHNVSVMPETVFESGSIGKQFTAFAVMMLVEEGKIKLDEKIGTYLGEVPESWSQITVRHVLNHTSGMTDYDWDKRKEFTEDELLEMAKKIPTAFAPGERWEYSNLGYLVLGITIHKVSGQFWGDFLHEKVFKPLGMKTARVISDRDIVMNRAAGYRYRKGILTNRDWLSATWNSTADGTLYLTSWDLIKWDTALRERRLLTRESFEQIWTPAKLNDGGTYHYGFGWVLKRVNGHKIIEHGGASNGFMSFLTRYPEDGLTVIVFGNSRPLDIARIAHFIAEEVEPALKPRELTPAEGGDIAIALEAYNDVAAWDFEETDFTSEVTSKITVEQKDLYTWPSEEGPARHYYLLEEDENNDGKEFRLRVEHDRITFYIKAVVNKDGKVTVFELEQD